MVLNEAELTAVDSGSHQIGIFWRLEVEPVQRLWLGFGKVEVGVDVLDPGGALYHGFGEIAQLPGLKQLINGKAERVDFTISGVSGRLLEIAATDAQSVKGKRVSVGFAFFDSVWQLLGPVRWMQHYTADYLSLNQSASDDVLSDEPVNRSIVLSCGSLLTARRRPSLGYFSDQDQKARFPGDRFCENTPRYANGANKTWPIF